VHRRAIHLVSTERHVEHALAQGKIARTWRSFVGDWAATSGLRPADPEMTRLAASAALGEVELDLGSSEPAALVATLDAAIGVLRQSGVDAATLRRTARPRAELFARLLETTSERLAAAGAFDRRSAGFMAAQAIERAAIDELPSAVVLEGFVDWTASAHAWVLALARRIPTTVRMPRWASESNTATKAPDVLLSALEERWQQDSRGPELELDDITWPGEVELLEAPSDGAEARAIAGAVRDALGAGVQPAAVAIVVPSLDESFLEPLRAALDEAAIPFSEPRGRPPIATPVVRAALAWLEIAAGPLVRDALVDLLRTSVVDAAPFVDGSTARERRERALILCRRLSRIPVGVDRDGTLLGDLLAADANDAGEPWLLTSLDKILAARRDLQREAPRSVLAARLVEGWRSMGLGPVPLGAVADLVAFEETPPVEPADARADENRARTLRLLRAQMREQSAGQAALLSAVERVQGAADGLGLGDEPVSIERLRIEIEEALAGAAPVATHRPASARIVRVGDMAFLPSAFLVVARASEGPFESTPTAHPALGEELVTSLPRRQRPLTASLTLAAHRTALLGAMACARRILVTRSVTDADGRPAAAAALFGELSSQRNIAFGPSSVLDPSARPLSPRAAELVALSQGGATPDLDLARRVAIEQERLDFFLDPRLPPTAVSGAISTADPRMAAHLERTVGGTTERPIAATALERAAACRFAAFALGVLGAATTDATGEELEPWQRGSLVHRALQIALEATRAQGERRDKADLVAFGTAAARRAMLRDRSSPLYRAEVERALRDVEAVLRWSLDDTSGFRFAYSERSFGETRANEGRAGDGARQARTAWPALRIGDGRDAVFVKGRIDRVDIAQGGARARVIDYKTGALPAWKDVGTLVFQPPLYALALWLHMGPLSMPEIRALYLDTSKRPPRPFPAEKSQVFSPEIMASAQLRAKAIVNRMRGGDVAPRPADALVCARCSVRDVCRRPAAMPIDDPELDVDGGPP
jgi:ATP-dependent helicase/nuclease subunit B